MPLSWLWIFLSACHPLTSDPLQNPIQFQLVLHGEPIPRVETTDCQSQGLNNCGLNHAGVIFERTRNWIWLANEVREQNVKIDLQISPDMALAWAGDESNIKLQRLGDITKDEYRDVIDEVFILNQQMIELDQMKLGLHIHNGREDELSGIGDLSYPSGGPSPCEESGDNPITEPPIEPLQKNLIWSLESLNTLATQMDTDISTFTGHFPRSMVSKSLMIQDPEALIGTEVPDSFKPSHLSSAYSECFLQVYDHASWFLWPSDTESSMGIGNGPIIQPSLRPTGSMNDHLNFDSDSSLGSNLRRLVQIFVAHRYAQMRSLPPLPWGLGIHTHLFQLYSGQPNPNKIGSRKNLAVDGNQYREDLIQLISFVKEFEENPWEGIANEEPILEWSWDVEDTPLTDEKSLEEWHDYVGLPMLRTALVESHLRSYDRNSDFDYFKFDQCKSGWEWGVTYGYSCLEDIVEIELYIPKEAMCISTNSILTANIDDSDWSSPEQCGHQQWIYPQGTLFLSQN
jgi:hypothetical protein